MNRLGWMLAALAPLPVGLVLAWWLRRRGVIARMSISDTARRLGIDNTPRDKSHVRNVLWLDARRAEVLALLRERWPDAVMTSAYRAPAVNEAVGGVPTSRHMRGLAFDISNVTTSVARAYLLSNVSRLEVKPRTVLDEGDHVHFDYNDPFTGEGGGDAPSIGVV